MTSAMAFVDRLKADEEFAILIAKCNDTSERIALIKQQGFNFIDDTRDAEQRVEHSLVNDGMCFSKKDLKCLRDIVYVACHCPILKACQ